MEKLVLTIKDTKGKVVKEIEAHTFELSFGTINNLMELLDINEESSAFEVLRKVSTAWKEVTGILNEVFPGVEKDEWKLVKINDLMPLVLQIVKFTFSEIMRIPVSSKN